MILYLVTKQYYDYVYGIFTAEELDKALTELAQADEHMTEAEKDADKQKTWYIHVHLKQYLEASKYGYNNAQQKPCKYGCEHMPYSMYVPILEYSKSLFRITTIELNKPKIEGKYLAWDG